MLTRIRRMATAGFLVVAVTAVGGCEVNNQGYEPRQPIAYSHAVHAGGSEIDCQYCHYAAERGRYAGIPPASLCMNCHSQVSKDHADVVKVAAAIESGEPIEWVRVHRLPDHAYFNHSAHVSTAGIECQTCHGAVESMGLVRQEAPLTMGWCVSCHRTDQPERPTASAMGLVLALTEDQEGAAANTGFTLYPGLPVPAARLTDCSVCHR